VALCRLEAASGVVPIQQIVGEFADDLAAIGWAKPVHNLRKFFILLDQDDE
jgi:hypothetical protein